MSTMLGGTIPITMIVILLVASGSVRAHTLDKLQQELTGREASWCCGDKRDTTIPAS
ncbi:MAG: hypothetical protein WD673_02745 [Alphaproteobacteria bacterium]